MSNVKRKNTDKFKIHPIIKRYGIKLIGLFIMIVSTICYIQGLPLLLIFMGGYLHVVGDVINTDTFIWLITSFAIVVPLIYCYISWIRFLWNNLIRYGKCVRQKHI